MTTDEAASQALAAKRKRVFTWIGIVALCSILIALAFYRHSLNFESTDDAFIEAHVVQVSPRVATNILKVNFDDNYEVKKGDLLIELDPRDFTVALEKAQAQLEQAKAQVAQADAQVQQAASQLAQAEAQSIQSQAQDSIAAINFNRSSSLYQKDIKAVAKQDVDTTKAGLDAARGAFAASEANVEAAKANVTAAKSQLGAAQASVQTAQTAVDDAELKLSYTKIPAPIDGRITKKSVEPGNYVQVGQSLFSVTPHDVWVVANFKETQLEKMRPGQLVDIEVDSQPGKAFKGHVDSFQKGTGARFSLLPPENATGNYVKVVQRIPVKIVFDEPYEAIQYLAPGESVEPTVRLRDFIKSDSQKESDKSKAAQK